MGGKHSTRSILITTDQTSCVPGSNITGKIYIKLEKAIRASTLWLKFKGKEQTQWSSSALSSKSKGKVNLLNLKAPVIVWEDGNIPGGDYEIPYTYTLPENLANSFHIDTPNYNADIMYKLKAEIEPEGHKKMKSSVVVDICNIVQVKEGSIASNKIPVSHCCSTGSFRVNVQLDKSAYTPLEKPQVNVEINNTESGANIHSITISLARQIILRSSKKHTFYNEYISSHKAKGCGKGKICERENAISTLLDLSKVQKTLHNAPTITSAKIECMYKLIFDFISNDSCVRNIGSCEIPLEISPQIMEIPRPLPEAPAGWNPVTFEVQKLSYEYAEAYAPSAPPLEDEE